ncbi:MAG TPA: bifunctional tetrahydrofolate synthase/dihydrofolate synthase [Thiobacillaceae bacterium]|nr:bifunctional tetrahydrofolate synthase/dihydrofolate synthase [Thiobacillaceae bacterium]HNU65151.1 bifunctional tetrahydrofolate synthase/dihydrofolate synthase [Thiobacillaceae bacterium]
MGATLDLAGWLACLEARNRESIVLGLERVRAVAERLGLAAGCPVISVGGTNGKGSVCAYLEAMLRAAGLKAGCYTSPHLLRYNERVRIDGQPATDAGLCEAFTAVEAARGGIPLTYFEQGTLAAFWLFRRQPLDALVLEVGLGGRLDAVNLWDADCAVIASVDLDHQTFLGHTREAIGYEKAGIFRAGKPAICGDPSPPASLMRHARALGVPLLCRDREIRIETRAEGWSLRVGDEVYPALPRPAMAGEHQLGNAACAMAALQCLRARLPVPRRALRDGLVAARQPGRLQILAHQPLRILDVAHNPHAARALAAGLATLAGTGTGRRIAVLAMLADKDARGVIAALLPWAQRWHVAGLDGPRGLSGASLAALLAEMGADHQCHAHVAAAWRAACREAGPADTICAFGSFYTAAELLTEIQVLPDSHG